MKKKAAFVLAIMMILSVVIGGMVAPVFAQEVLPENDQIHRVYGENRYQTAYEIAKIQYQDMDTVIIVRGDEEEGIPQVADALAASGLAGAINAPILLAQQDRLSSATTKAIEESKPSNAIVIGGENAIHNSVVQELEALDVVVERVSGDNRYGSAVAVAARADLAVDTAIIVNGHALVDSLVAGPYSHKTGYPILLVQGDRIPADTEAVLGEYDAFIIVGGVDVVGEEVKNQLDKLGEVLRIGGVNREETSVLFAEKFMEDSQMPSMVNGRSFSDAVAASTLEEAILYLDLRFDRDLDSEHNDLVRAWLGTKDSFRAIGGEAVISNGVYQQIKENIVQPPIAVSEISMDQADQTLAIGKTLALSVTLSPEDATNKAVTWTTSDASVATVDENGLVEALTEGEVAITTTSDDDNTAYDSIAITVGTGVGNTQELTDALNDDLVALILVEDGTYDFGNEYLLEIDREVEIRAINELEAKIMAKHVEVLADNITLRGLEIEVSQGQISNALSTKANVAIKGLALHNLTINGVVGFTIEDNGEVVMENVKITADSPNNKVWFIGPNWEGLEGVTVNGISVDNPEALAQEIFEKNEIKSVELNLSSGKVIYMNI